MKCRTMTFFLLLLVIIPTAASAQNTKQELNDQLWEAARNGNASAVTALLDKGAEVNAKFRYGATALFKAAERGHVEVVKVLLARGADASVEDTFYHATAMTWALDKKHVEVVRALLEKDPKGVDDVLMTGVREGNVALIEVALARGGAKPETLSAALAAVSGETLSAAQLAENGVQKKAAIIEMLKNAGALPPFEVDAATLQSYVAKYKNEQGFEIAISLKDGKLSATPTGQQALALIAVDKITFRPTAFDGLVITMNLDAGKVIGFTLKQGANVQVFKKVE